MLSLLHHVERVPLSAGRVEGAQLWRSCSLWWRVHGSDEIRASLSTWPVERPTNWTARFSAPLTTKERDRLRLSMERGRPYGDDEWVRRTVKQLGLEHTVRPEGRPRKVS